MAAANKRGGFSVYLGDGGGEVWRRAADHGLPCVETDRSGSYQGGWATGILLRDMNGDSHLDVVAAHQTGPRVWLGDGKAHWRPGFQGLPTPLMGGLYRSTAVADVNEDGRPDLMAANWVNGAELFLQNPDGSWQAAIDPMPTLKGGAQAVAVTDVDRDGHMDLVIAGSRERQQAVNQWGLFVRRGDGRGGWSEFPAAGLPETGLVQVWGIRVGDVNQDGWPDLAVTTGSRRADQAEAVSASQKAATKPASEGAEASPAPQPVVTPAPPLPRLQVWLTQAESAGEKEPR